MNRKERRSQISEFILHSKSFIKQKDELTETKLPDGSIKFYIEGFASTEVQDGSGDIVRVDGIDTSRFEINPVLQRGHKRGSENTIGKIVKIEKVAGKGMYIGADIILSPEIEDHKAIIHGLRHGLINGFSIGFKEVQSSYDETIKANVIEKLELYEISLVDIPDNPLTVRKFIDKIISKESEEVDEGEEKTEEEILSEVKEEILEVENIENPDSTIGENALTDATESDPTLISQEASSEALSNEITEETVEEVVNEEVVQEQGVIIPPVLELDLSSAEKDFLTKSLGLAEVKEGDMIYYRIAYEDMIYPEIEDKPNIGYIFKIKTEGTAFGCCGDIMEASIEEPIIYVLQYVEVNNTLVPTSTTTICEFEDMLIEGMYDGTMKATKVPELKDLEVTPNILQPEISGNADIETTVEETEKESGNALEVKVLGEEKNNLEKMLSDMITINEKLIADKKELQTIIDKVKKNKATVGIHFEGSKEQPTSRIGNIVSMIRG